MELLQPFGLQHKQLPLLCSSSELLSTNPGFHAATGSRHRPICSCPTSLVLDNKVAMVVVDDNAVVIENAVVDDTR